ncbi:MAG TPA: ABC transporter ATP-binding protein [Dehalococcoidia bacterium]|nr:ABC transporter ATP-binding protein [Dehalococcoidia bacterium]
MSTTTLRVTPNERSPNSEHDVVLRVRGLVKRYGAITAVRDLDLDLYRGEVFGLLGPNGSGKSTTLGCVLGLIAPNHGRIEAFGFDLTRDRWEVLRRIGAIIETPALYGHLSGRDNLQALAISVGGLPQGRIEELLDLVGLRERADDKFKTYSLGMKQRLGIASTLLTDPELIILDEPTNGLDPAGQREVRNLIPRLAAEGRTVLLASHLLHDVEQVCDRIAILRRGEVLAVGGVGELLRTERRFRISLSPAELAPAETILRSMAGIAAIEQRDTSLVVNAPSLTGRDVNRALSEAGIFAEELRSEGASLEDYFLELTTEETADA